MKTHAAPKEFNYYIKTQVQSPFTFNLAKIYDNHHGHYYQDNVSYVLPLNGKVKYENVECWVVNQEKQGYLYFWFYSEADFKTLLEDIKTKLRLREAKKTHAYYKYSAQQNNWACYGSYKQRYVKNLIGYREYLDVINKDIENLQVHKEFLEELGESKSLNYLLYGPPGVGKTSLIMTLATQHDFPVFVVNPNGLNPADLSGALNPNQCLDKIKILLFEDFDRFLENQKQSEKFGNNIMSQILNSLESIDTKQNCIRFFTGNDCNAIFNTLALITRMSGIFEFHMPDREQFKSKFNQLCPNQDLQNLELLLDKVMESGLTLRPFTNYIIRYMFDEDPLIKMIDNFDKFGFHKLQPER